MTGIVMDITEREESEHTIRKAQEDARQHGSETTALLKAVRAVLEFESLGEAARSIFDACKELIGATGGYIALRDKKSNENNLVFLDAGNIGCNVDTALPMPVRGLRQEAYTSGSVLYDNAFESSKWVELLPEGHPVLQNVMFSPLLMRGEAVGLLGLANKTGGFNDNDARLVKAFSELAVIALRRSRNLESLQASEAKFRSVTETATDAIITIDTVGKMVHYNSATERLFGYSHRDQMPHLVIDIIPERFRKDHIKGLQRVTSTGESHIIGRTLETWGLRKDGSEFPLELSLSSWNVEKDLYFTAIIRDISDRRQAETKLRDAYETLEDRVKERTAELSDVNEKLKQEMLDRKLVAERLRLSTVELRAERKALERKNAALREILHQIETEKTNIRKQLTANITHSVIPTLQSLKERSDSQMAKVFDIVEAELMDVVSPLLIRLMDASSQLTPRELAVCGLIKNGLSSKEIARSLCISEETIRKQRQRIRKKLGISNQKISLPTFLASLNLPDSGNNT